MSRGDIFTAEIDRISSAGNGLISTESGHINIGPVIQGAEGTEITAEMDRSVFARLITKDVRAENYETRYGVLKTPSNPSSTVSLPPVEERSTSQIGRSTFCSRCGSLIYPSEGGSRVCSSCGYEESDSTVENETKTGSETTDDSAEKIDNEVSDNEEGSTKAQQNSKIVSPSERENTTSSDPNRDTDTSKLRKKAVESAVEEVPQGASTKQHETPTYNRSPAVKEYVKARADGMCEGCREAAPFTSKTGEPYLHAHHIHELSDGGSDTPDTVVALCPNCHYRIHHGEDGDEYNQELLQIVQEKENGNR
jgi:DNA-directed RNA polymerase subunit M/transcription elongation factor TFIIS